jgi:hypothetical protein
VRDEGSQLDIELVPGVLKFVCCLVMTYVLYWLSTRHDVTVVTKRGGRKEELSSKTFQPGVIDCPVMAPWAK